MRAKSKCCKKFKKKGKGCKSCPLISALKKRDRKDLLSKYT